MKLSGINPKKIFRSSSTKNTRSVSRSLSSNTSSSSSYDSSDLTHLTTNNNNNKNNGSATPTTVLPTTDNDGKLTRAELAALLSRVGAEPLTEEELAVVLSEVDREGSGCISLEELGSGFGEAELREAFEYFDADGDGKISAEELLGVFTLIGGEEDEGRCSLEDCRRMIRGVDTNNDGFVCFQDFSKMMMTGLDTT